MQSALPSRALIYSRRSLPFVFSLFLSLLGAIQLPVPGSAALFGDLALLAVFYWVVHRPMLLPLPLVFALGLLGDILGESRAGMGPLMMLLLYAGTMWARRILANRSFVTLWLGACLAVGAVLWVEAIILWLREDLWIGLRPVAIAWVMASALYPIVAGIFNWIQRRWMRDV